MKYLIFLLLFSTSVFSQNYHYALGGRQIEPTPEPSFVRNENNLFYQEPFENNNLDLDPYLSDFYPEFALDHSFTLEKSIKKTGNSAGRIEVRKNDPLIWGGTRAEYSQSWRSTKSEGWYGFSQYFPDSYAPDPVPEIVGQWHDREDTGEYAGRSPSNSLQVANDRFRWQLRWDADPIMANGTSDGHIYIDLGPLPKNRWIDWVVHIKFSHTNEGVLEVWKDGVKVIDRQNLPNSYNDTNFPYMKIGIYKWTWGDVNEKVMYWDEVRIGNENSSYDEVKPGN